MLSDDVHILKPSGALPYTGGTREALLLRKALGERQMTSAGIDWKQVEQKGQTVILDLRLMITYGIRY
jgi:hypothetical protein